MVTINYVNGFYYKNNVLQFFPHPKGYVKHKGNSTYLYVYQYKGHLGSNGLRYADIDGNGSINPANEILEETELARFAETKTYKVNNGKPWKVYKSDDVIGASAANETKYMRVELTTGTNELHSSPITKEQYYKLIK